MAIQHVIVIIGTANLTPPDPPSDSPVTPRPPILNTWGDQDPQPKNLVGSEPPRTPNMAPMFATLISVSSEMEQYDLLQRIPEHH